MSAFGRHLRLRFEGFKRVAACRRTGPQDGGRASERDAAMGKAVPLIDRRIALSAREMRASSAGPDFESKDHLTQFEAT